MFTISIASRVSSLVRRAETYVQWFHEICLVGNRMYAKWTVALWCCRFVFFDRLFFSIFRCFCRPRWRRCTSCNIKVRWFHMQKLVLHCLNYLGLQSVARMHAWRICKHFWIHHWFWRVLYLCQRHWYFVSPLSSCRICRILSRP